MNRVYQFLEQGEKIPVRFSSKATTEEGVFRAFAKKNFKLLKEGTIYDLYVNINFGFGKIASAYWNGKSFVKVACKTSINCPFSKRSGKSYVEEIKKEF